MAFTGVRAILRASPVLVPFPYLVISDELLASFYPDRLVEAPRSHVIARTCELTWQFSQAKLFGRYQIAFHTAECKHRVLRTRPLLSKCCSYATKWLSHETGLAL